MVEGERDRSLIDDELIRRRVRQIADAKPPEPRWQALSKHPLVTIFFGFVLTWTVGTLLTDQINEQRRETAQAAERARVRNEASAEAVASYARLLSEQQVRASMLLSALERSSRIEEVRDRKQAYDEAFAGWQANLQPTFLSIRESLGQRGYSPFEQFADETLVPLYAAVDSGLLAAYDAREAGLRTAELAHVEAMLAVAGNCGRAVASHLYQLLGAIAERLETTPEGISPESVQVLRIQCEADGASLLRREP
ncbi:MAG: hypothetical protein WD737_04325 [Gemmatimonadota bacterium]